MNKLLLIDGHSILNRAFYGVPELSNSAGLHTNAVYGFLNIMFKVLDEEKASHMAVAFDLPAPTFRHEAYEDYKGTRKSMPEELREQVPLMQELLRAMGISVITKEGFEADDILGTLAKKYAGEEVEVSIVSGDRDLLQLSDTHIKIRIPKTSKGQTVVKDYLPENVLEEYGVTPKEFIDVKALMGDASDNVPGVPSIGEKTATAIISLYHSIENAYENVDVLKPPRASKALKEHYEEAKFSKFLVTIKTDVELTKTLDDMKIEDIYTRESLEIIKKLEFKSIEKRYTAQKLEEINDFKLERFDIDNKEKLDILLQDLNDKELGISQVTKSETTPFSTEEIKSIHSLFICDNDKNYHYIKLGHEELKFCLEKLIKQGNKIYSFNIKELSKICELDFAENIFDVGIAAYLINPLKDSYEVEDIARDYANMSISNKKELLDKKETATELDMQNEKAFEYASSLAYIGFKSGSVLLNKLKELDMYELYTDIELPLAFSLARMEEAGIKVDSLALKEYGDKLLKGIDKLEKEIYEDTGEIFNINSPKQLGEILFEKLGIPGGKKTKTGYSTAADILEKLAPEYKVISKILEYRQLTKLNSTYAQGLSAYIGSDGRIHGNFNQTITATGRISSTEPNLQNIPIRTELGSKIRDVFVPKEGYVFIDADYSQIELRVLAALSDDEKLIESYKTGKDIHAITASQVFGVPLSEVTPNLRRNAKAVNFGVVYGISAFGLSEGLSISRQEAKDYINNYFKTYPKVKEFLDKQVKLAKEEGFVRTLYKRLRPIPEIKSSNFMQRAFGDRVAMNSPIQGTAADIMKIAMLKVDEELKKSELDARIVLQVHDELLIEAKREVAEKVRILVEETMRNAVKLKVDLEVEAKIGESWLRAK